MMLLILKAECVTSSSHQLFSWLESRPDALMYRVQSRILCTLFTRFLTFTAYLLTVQVMALAVAFIKAYASNQHVRVLVDKTLCKLNNDRGSHSVFVVLHTPA